jgi:amino acid adenylation domain-containing protein
VLSSVFTFPKVVMSDRAQVVFPAGQGRGPANPFQVFPLEEVEQSIPARFARQVLRNPARIAVESPHERLTYDELDQAANRLATAILDRCGTQPEPVAFLLAHGCPQLVAVLGILKAGKIYLPLDTAYPPARNSAVLEDARPELIVTDHANRLMAEQLSAGCPLVNLDELSASRSHRGPQLALEPDRPANIIYTSGSTGRPAGLVHSHRNILHVALKYTNNLHVGCEDRSVLLYSCTFAGSVADIFSCLLSGATLLPYDLRRQGIANLGRWLADKDITLYQSVPTVFRQFAATLQGAERLPRLRLIRLGGEPITPRDVLLHRQHFGPGCVLAVSLGATEILGIRLYFVDRDAPLTGPRVPVGYALQDTEVLILDENGEPAGPGCVGEMAVRSPYLALGYWRDAERTEEAFRPDPTRPGTRVYRLGDLGVIRPDGCLDYLGRKDWQVKVRGHRVETSEVEAALLRLGGVRDAVVVGRSSASGGQRLVAYVVPDGEPAPTVSTLRGALAQRLPDFMIPSAFVLLEALPTTPSGKVDRQALPEPGAARPALRDPCAPPQDALQILLLEVWQECLNVSPIGVRDDFFELGGDSILAVEMALRVEEVCGRRVAQETLLSMRTVEQLARHLVQPPTSAACAPATEIQRGDAGRPLFFMHGDINGGGIYCLPLARRLGETVPFVAVHPHGVVHPRVPATIEEMASDFLRVVHATQPEGPYLLGGHCNGGLVAFEMAQQLLRRGESVDYLAIIAPPAVVQWEGSIPSATGGVPAGNASVGAYALLETYLRPARPVDLTGLPQALRGPRLMQAYHDACIRYVVRPYPGTGFVVLPWADYTLHESLRRWAGVGPRVPVRVISGGHLSVLTSRYGPGLAQVMRHHLPKREAVRPAAG